MIVAISKGDGPFTEYWQTYCETTGINYKLVNCYDNDIIEQVSGCAVLLWHYHHRSQKDVLFSKQLLFSFEQADIKVFPDFNTSWHFNDKIGQKYLLEAIGAPLVPSYVFYEKYDALRWVKSTEYPKVFKLTGGAGSANVKLVKHKSSALRLVKKSFGKGIHVFDRWENCKGRFIKFIQGEETMVGVIKGIGRLLIPIRDANLIKRERGYVYFQDFIPDNKSDIRVIVIGDKAFAIKRLVRKNDFRASGSGLIIHKKEEIDIRCVRIAFETSKRLKSQCLAYDFIFSKNNEPLILEMSYGFSPSGYFGCPGYWDSDLSWHEGEFNPYGWMIDLVVNSCK